MDEPKAVCKTICKRVVYSGRVQGVGFRYTAQQLAGGFPVAGYVRNLANGNVELMAEGAIEDVNGFLDSLGSRLSAYIERSQVQEEQTAGLVGFRIRY
jgi:acylphosphatase